MGKDPNRDEKGHFKKGHSIPGPGRPRRKVEEDYLSITVSSVSVTQWKKVIKKAIEDAIGGDWRARQFLAEYIIGKPTQYVQADVQAGLDESSLTVLDALVALVFTLVEDAEDRKRVKEGLRQIIDGYSDGGGARSQKT